MIKRWVMLTGIGDVAGSDVAGVGDVARDEVVTLQGVTLQGLDTWQGTKRLFKVRPNERRTGDTLRAQIVLGQDLQR